MNKMYHVFFTFLSIPLGFLSYYFSFLYPAEIVSRIFLNFFQLISVPIIFFSLASSLSGMKSLREVKDMGGKILSYTLFTTLIAASISLLLLVFLHPSNPSLSLNVGEELKNHTGSYLSFLLKMVPDNFIKAFLENNIMGVAFLGAIAGLCTLRLEEEQKVFVRQVFSSFFSLILKVTEWLLYLMPLAIWAFSAVFFNEAFSGSGNLEALFLYVVCVLGSNVIQGVFIIPAFLKWKGASPSKVLVGMHPALLTAFFSKSSNIALPLAINCAVKELNISPKVAKVSFPMCSVINMNGCASFILTTVLFVSMCHGMTFSPLELVFWILLATVAAVGNAGVPMGCYFLSGAFLTGMGVPLYILGLILPFYTFFDMVETALNVWSDSAIAVVIDKDSQRQAS